jgi:hypothetical protein
MSGQGGAQSSMRSCPSEKQRRLTGLRLNSDHAITRSCGFRSRLASWVEPYRKLLPSRKEAFDRNSKSASNCGSLIVQNVAFARFDSTDRRTINDYSARSKPPRKIFLGDCWLSRQPQFPDSSPNNVFSGFKFCSLQGV